MDLLTLDTAAFNVTGMVEGYTSLIWTERYQAPGSFELKTPRILETMSLLPELSFVCIRDSKEVMIVESHSVEVNADGRRELTTTGRTAESFLEHRWWAKENVDKPGKMRATYSIEDALMVYVWNAIINNTTTDAINASMMSLGRHGGNVLPNVVITDSFTVASGNAQRWVAPGDVHTGMMKWLKARKIGVRCIRPIVPSIKVFTVTASSGAITRTITSNVNKLCIDFYNGADLTDDVIFDHEQGDLLNPKYFFSSQGYESGVVTNTTDVYNHHAYRLDEVASPPGTGNYHTQYDGWARREHYHWYGDYPDDEDVTWMEQLWDYGYSYLEKEGSRQVIIDCAINPLVSSKYKVDYNLGDRVTVRGEFGVDQTMWVTEYTRTEDFSGETGYPTLSFTPS